MLLMIGRMIPAEWQKLGVFLGIAYQQLESMIKVKKPNEMAMEMLQAWWNRTDTHSRWGELYHGLASVHRQDLLKAAQEYFKKNSIDYNAPDNHTMDRYFAVLSECIPVHWQDMAAYLGLPREKVVAINQQPQQDLSFHTFKVLKMWQSLPTSTHHQLIRV